MGYFKNLMIHKEGHGDKCGICGKTLYKTGIERKNGNVTKPTKDQLMNHITCERKQIRNNRRIQL